MMDVQKIIDQLPYTEPFLFVDQLEHVDREGAKGTYTFRSDSFFYQGHFKDNPVTPGAILTECCAQIGVVCLGIYLLDGQSHAASKVALTQSEMEYLLPVFPDETVFVASEKIYFRFNKLKCKVSMRNTNGELICKGIIAGILKVDDGAV